MTTLATSPSYVVARPHAKLYPVGHVLSSVMYGTSVWYEGGMHVPVGCTGHVPPRFVVGVGAPYIQLKLIPRISEREKCDTTTYQKASSSTHLDEGDHVEGRVGKAVVAMFN